MKPALFIILLTSISFSADTPAKKADAPAKKAPAKKVYPKNPVPTAANVRYGPAERNVFDFWQAKSDTPAPLLFYIHGGGWMGGDKAGIAVEPFLKEGISVVSINYRYISQAQDVVPPVKAPLTDAARALQFVRSKAGEWNIDKTRIAASGGSAGACSSLWLAFHDDMADPKSSDPVARESTRLLTAAVNGPQTTLDPKQMREWTPNSRYGGHAFGKSNEFKNFDDFVAARERILPWIKNTRPALVTSDDPPVFCIQQRRHRSGAEGSTRNFGVKLPGALQGQRREL
ncbi:MAG: alpha/beta hydrolase [Prosthecobacter sp.]